jgi:phosphatidylglycerophosphate synthase
MAAPIGAKERDYWWTVLVVDPVAFPLTRFFEKHRLLTPDQVTFASLIVGLPVGVAYSTGRVGLIIGAVLFYLSFVLDCVDGKLARALAVTSKRGKALDELADGARRASAAIGLGFYLWREEAASVDFVWLVAFAVLSFYFMEISGAPRGEPAGGPGNWEQLLTRHRLLPTPGMPDVSAIVYVLAPLSGLVVAGLIVGLVMVGAGILLSVVRRLRT